MDKEDGKVPSTGKEQEENVEVIDGEATESEEEEEDSQCDHSVTSTASARSNPRPEEASQASLTFGNITLSSVTGTVQKHIGVLSRQATLENINIGLIKKQQSRDGELEGGERKPSLPPSSSSPTFPSLLHKKLYDNNVQLYQSVHTVYQESFDKNLADLKKMEVEVNTKTRISLQEATQYCQEAGHSCRQVSSSLANLSNQLEASSLSRLRSERQPPRQTRIQ